MEYPVYGSSRSPLGLLVSFLYSTVRSTSRCRPSIYRVVYFLPSKRTCCCWHLALALRNLNPNSGLLNTLLVLVGIHQPQIGNLQEICLGQAMADLAGSLGCGQHHYDLSSARTSPDTLMEAAEPSMAPGGGGACSPLVSPITLEPLDRRRDLYIPMLHPRAYVLRRRSQPGGQALCGSPLNSTLFYSVYIYQQGFVYLKMGYASAMAWILFIIILVCTILGSRSSERWTRFEGGVQAHRQLTVSVPRAASRTKRGWRQ